MKKSVLCYGVTTLKWVFPQIVIKKLRYFYLIWKECTVINLLSTKQGDQNVCLGSTHIFSQQQQVYVHSVFYNITFYEFTYIIQ